MAKKIKNKIAITFIEDGFNQFRQYTNDITDIPKHIIQNHWQAFYCNKTSNQNYSIHLCMCFFFIKYKFKCFKFTIKKQHNSTKNTQKYTKNKKNKGMLKHL